METCKHCGKPLIPYGGKCIYCGKAPDEHGISQCGGRNSESGLPPVRTFTVNGVSFNMILVEGGTFWMGAQYTNPQGHNYDPAANWWNAADGVGEGPVHEVTLSSFFIGETVITQSLWRACGGEKATMHGGWCHGKGDNLPAYNISWNDFKEFIHILNQYTGQKFRMPTEAEWEYAARGGNRSRNTKYSGSDTLDNVGWYWKNSGDKVLLGTEKDMDWRKMQANKCRIHAVKEKTPNELGLFDMSGNIWEWCQDIWGGYEDRPQFDPWGPYPSYDNNDSRIVRGGSWCDYERNCRVTFRFSLPPHENWLGGGIMGLRLCLPC